MRLEETTVADIHGAMRAGTLTARALVDEYLNRIETLDRRGPSINAILAVNRRAKARANELDDHLARSGDLSGSLHGIPVIVKDCIETRDLPTTFGSCAVRDYQPAVDAAVVRKLKKAGAIILAKTTLPDFATSWFSFSSTSGDTRNPYALDHDSGGSSAGTGAGIAANLAAVGIGTDCGGSIRVPASFCNLVGMRSTPGLVSRAGYPYLVAFQDTIGPMTRTVEDAATVFDALAGFDAADPYTAAYAIARPPRSYRDELDAGALRGAVLGLVVNALGSSDAETASVNAVVGEAIEAIRAAGANVVEVEIPDLARQIEATSQCVTHTKHDVNAFLASRPELAGQTLQRIVQREQFHPALDLIRAVMAGPDDPTCDPDSFRRLAAREAFTRDLVNLMAVRGIDALIYPSVQVPPPTMAGRYAWVGRPFPTNTLIASQAWMPAMTVPAGFTEADLPVGLDFLTKPYDEVTLFRLGYSFEQSTHHRSAPMVGPRTPAP